MDYFMTNNISLALIIAFAVLLVLYLQAEKYNDGTIGFKRATALKLILSGIFCTVGVIGYLSLIENAFRSDAFFGMKRLVLIGLFTAFVGDFFLQYIKRDVNKFIIGICCFMTTQVLLIISMCALFRVGFQEIVITIIVLLLFLTLMRKQNWQLGKEQKPITAYTIAISFMAAKAVVCLFTDKTVGGLMLAAGAVLFLLSDLLLGIWSYHSGKRIHANLNWITYFSGLMLIALSINPYFDIYLG